MMICKDKEQNEKTIMLERLLKYFRRAALALCIAFSVLFWCGYYIAGRQGLYYQWNFWFLGMGMTCVSVVAIVAVTFMKLFGVRRICILCLGTIGSKLRLCRMEECF